MRCGSALTSLGAAVLLAAGSPALAGHSATAPALRSAASFVVLGHSSVTNTGSTRVTGNVGVSPGNAVTGFSSAIFSAGDIRRDDALARQARIDGGAAADDLLKQTCDVVFESAALDGKTLASGVYCFAEPHARLNGTLILDAKGDRNAVWIFKITGALTIAADASVLVIGNGYDGNVFWWTRDAATLGARSTFIGNIFAGSNITLGNGASLSGRAFARTGSVTLDANDVSLCCAPLLLAPATLPNEILGTHYRQTVTASGGMAPYTFTISSGSLPFGLALASNGIVEGIPVLTGTFEFTVTATDALGCSSTAAYGIRIDCGAPTVLPAATVGVEYPPFPLLFDGTPPFACAVSAGTLPRGLRPDACIIKGTPETTGRYDVVVESTDAAGVRRSHCLTIVVGECPIVFLPPDPPAGTACELYPHTFDASGGTPPYVFTAPESALPPGWVLSSTGELSGMTPAAGTYVIPVTATDALSQSCSRTYTIPVRCPPPEGTAVILPDGIVGVPYNEPIPAPACGGPATFSGTPPSPLFIEHGMVRGIPATPGTYRFVVTSQTADMCTTTREVTITIGCGEIALSPLPPMVKGVFYNQTIVVTPPGESYRLSAPELPNGLFLKGRRIYGTPHTSGPYIFTVTAEDTMSGCTGSRTYNLRCPRLVAGPAVLPDGKVGVAYPDITFSVTEGTAPYVFTESSGALPPGLELSSTGTLFGTPTAAGTFAVDIRVTDANGCSTVISFCGIDIGAGSCPGGTTITLSPPALPAATPGEPYLQVITAAGGTAPYTFSVSAGVLPPGLVLSPAGTISGAPTETGCFELTITATDANGCRGSVCYVLCNGVAIPAMSPWMLFAVSILLACAGWIAIGRG